MCGRVGAIAGAIFVVKGEGVGKSGKMCKKGIDMAGEVLYNDSS